VKKTCILKKSTIQHDLKLKHNTKNIKYPLDYLIGNQTGVQKPIKTNEKEKRMGRKEQTNPEISDVKNIIYVHIYIHFIGKRSHFLWIFRKFRM